MSSNRQILVSTTKARQAPKAFLVALVPELTPGTALLATEQPILHHTSGVGLQVLDDQPLAASLVN